MSPDQIIAKQQVLLKKCKQEFVSAMNHDSLNDHCANGIIDGINSLSEEIKTGRYERALND